MAHQLSVLQFLLILGEEDVPEEKSKSSSQQSVESESKPFSIPLFPEDIAAIS